MSARQPTLAPYAFVSYASADRERVLPGVAALRAAGVSVWLDQQGIAGGANYAQEIADAIKGAAALLLCCTPAALASRNVKQEIALGWRYERPYVPLRLDPVAIPDDLAYWLEAAQWVDLLDRPTADWLPEVLAALGQMGLTAAPAPAPPDAPEVPPATPRHNLPAQLTSFVGREREVADLGALLATQRLVTLTGVGGTGKTRLALAIAEHLLPDYPEGVWLVELAPLADPALVPQALANVIGVRAQPGEALTTTLQRVLRDQRALLLLDNCEHLLDPCAALAEALLRGCPALHILATSREQLGVPGEATYRVPSLALPAATDDASALAGSEAVRLFVARARAAQPDFALSDENAALVAGLCARLDGIPLALELAAARLRAVPLAEVVARLDDRFRLLTGGSRTALPRQRTLQATLDWSYRLLEPEEQALLRRLSVFAGGWTLAAAEAVCASDGLDDWQVLDLLTRLIDKSLVMPEATSGEARYRLLETVRQYATERLVEANEAGVARQRHATWALAYAEARGYWDNPITRTTVAALDAEQENLHQGLAWLREHDPERGLRLAAALVGFWHIRGLMATARPWAVELLDAVPPGGRAHAQLALWAAIWASGTPETLHGEVVAAVAEARAAGEARLVVFGLSYGALFTAQTPVRLAAAAAAVAEARLAGDARFLGIGLWLQGDTLVRAGAYAQVVAAGREAVAALRAVGEEWYLAEALVQLGQGLVGVGDGAAARAALAEALALFAGLGDRHEVIFALAFRAELALWEGDTAGALGCLAEIEGHWAATGSRNFAQTHAELLGRARWAQGERAPARAAWRRALSLARAQGEYDWMRGRSASALEGVARLVAAHDPAGAARLLGAAAGGRAAYGLARHPANEAAHTALVADVQASLGAGFAAAWAAGEALPRDEALAEAEAALGEEAT